jgi:hypothetical protein
VETLPPQAHPFEKERLIEPDFGDRRARPERAVQGIESKNHVVGVLVDPSPSEIGDAQVVEGRGGGVRAVGSFFEKRDRRAHLAVDQAEHRDIAQGRGRAGSSDRFFYLSLQLHQTRAAVSGADLSPEAGQGREQRSFRGSEIQGLRLGLERPEPDSPTGHDGEKTGNSFPGTHLLAFRGRWNDRL